MNKMKKLIIFCGIFLFLIRNNAQNVGINATGAPPNASAGLDVDFNNRGVLIPRLALTARNNNAPIGAGIATGLLVYNTATSGAFPNNVYPGFYYWNGTVWLRLVSGISDGWQIDGNTLTGTLPGTPNEFIGTLNAADFIFRTNNLERMRILNGGRVSINSGATANGQLYAVGNFAPSLTDLGTIMARNNNSSGIAINGTGQNGIDNGLVAGSGGSFSGILTGCFSYYSTGGAGQCYIGQDAFSAQWNIGHWTGTAYRKILGPGTVSTIIKDLNEEYVLMNAPECPENLFMDFGTACLENGKKHIEIDPILSKNILVDQNHPLKVFITLEGDCNGVYITNKNIHGFDVIELKNGKSNTCFSWQVVATMGDQIHDGINGKRVAKYDKRFEKAPKIEENLINKNAKK
jgi:hypothetical protein